MPGARLTLRGREGEGATLSERLTVGGGSCLHLIVGCGVGCHDGGEVRCFVHEISLQGRSVDSRSDVDSSASGSEVCLCCSLGVKLASDVPCEQGAKDQGSEGGGEEESGFHGGRLN